MNKEQWHFGFCDMIVFLTVFGTAASLLNTYIKTKNQKPTVIYINEEKIIKNREKEK